MRARVSITTTAWLYDHEPCKTRCNYVREVTRMMKITLASMPQGIIVLEVPEKVILRIQRNEPLSRVK